MRYVMHIHINLIDKLNIREVLLMKPIETLLEKALDRKPRCLTYKTTHSHDNLYAWLKAILPTWEIFIPELEEEGSTRQSFSALSDWPTINIRDTVKHWIEEQNVENGDFLCSSNRKAQIRSLFIKSVHFPP